jgi:hypothetical protein
MKLKLSKGVTGFWNDETPARYVVTGSQMGRRNLLPDNTAQKIKLHLRRLKLIDGACYDGGGAYWGQGKPLFMAFTGHKVSDSKQNWELIPGDVQIFFRADSRAQAKQIVRQTLPAATFYA